jgi:hypothetical protein
MLHRVAGQWVSVGFWVAIDKMSTRSAGGKAPRPTWARRILQPGESVGEIPSTPQAHGMAITVHLSGDPEIRRLIGRCGPQDQPTSECQGLGSGMRTGEQL